MVLTKTGNKWGVCKNVNVCKIIKLGFLIRTKGWKKVKKLISGGRLLGSWEYFRNPIIILLCAIENFLVNICRVMIGVLISSKGESLDKVPRIKQKFCDLAKHFKHEKEVCNKLFNTLKGEECENNRINTTEDLYEKLYAEIPNLIVAKFLKAFQTIGFHGILEKIHDTFHHSPNLV